MAEAPGPIPPKTSSPAGDGDTTAPTVVPAIAPKARGIQRITRSLGTFDSLEQREFRWYFLAVVTQMAGMMMQMLVAAYLAFELTGSYAALGGIALASAVPMIGLYGFSILVARVLMPAASGDETGAGED